MEGFEKRSGTLQDDFADGVDWLLQQGIGERERVCYVGEGMGGYLGLVGAMGSESKARCAAHFAFSNLQRGQFSGRLTPALTRHEFVWDWWSRRDGRLFRSGGVGPWGPIETQSETRRLAGMRSPLLKPDHRGFPILLDTPKHAARVHTQQSRHYRRAMADARELSSWMPDGGTWEVEFLRNVDRFLQEQLRRND